MVLFSSTIVSLSPFLGGRAASWSSSSARWIFSFLWRPPTTSPAHFHQPRNPLSFCKYRWLCLDANPLLSFFFKRQVPPGGLGPITKSPRWDFWWFGSCQRFQRVSWVVGGGVHCYIWPIAHSIVCVCVSSSFGTLHTESRTKRDRLNKRTRVEHVRPRIIFLTKKKMARPIRIYIISTDKRPLNAPSPPGGTCGDFGTWWTCHVMMSRTKWFYSESWGICVVRHAGQAPPTGHAHSGRQSRGKSLVRSKDPPGLFRFCRGPHSKSISIGPSHVNEFFF